MASDPQLPTLPCDGHPQDPTRRGTVLPIGVSLAMFAPLVGLAIAVAATILSVGWNSEKKIERGAG